MRIPLVWLIRGGVAYAVLVGFVALIVALVVVFRPKSGEETAGSDVWTCSMHPQVRLPEAGRCPICGMNLIPVSQLSDEQARVSQQARIVTQAVTFRELFKEVRTVGKLDFNERRVAHIASRVAGRVDRLFVDFTGIEVKKGDHLVSIYSPQLYVAQTELFQSLRRYEQAQGDRRLDEQRVLESARTKLQLLGILEEQIVEMEKSRQELTHLTIYAPIGGTVIEKNIREGQYVREGDSLYRIADLDPIWLYLDVYEYDLGWIRYGQPVDVRVEAYPGEVFRGTVVFIDRFLDDKTRTLRVRVNLKNLDRRLKPAMYASATIRVQLLPDGTPRPTGLEGKFICPMHPEVIQDKPGKCTVCEMPLDVVPSPRAALPVDKRPSDPASARSTTDGKVLAAPISAVLDTGRRQVAYRKTKDGAFELVELVIGRRAEAMTDGNVVGGFYAVLSGLNDGDEVVVRGAFLLDSQRQIEGMPSLLDVEGRGPANLHGEHGSHAAQPSKQPSSPAPAASHKH
jgi:Cu(I)/Ag(I) efflux system membrane fusion protein